MNIQEFSAEFDILYNNIASNLAPGLDEYEKSVFLTKAQDELVKNYFNKQGNKYQQSYGDSSKRNISLENLIDVYSAPLEYRTDVIKVDVRSLVLSNPPDALIILNESVRAETSPGKFTQFNVIELSPEEYNRVLSRPYSRPPIGVVWKLKSGTDIENSNALYEYIMPIDNEDTQVYFRYVMKPFPIILENLEGITINNESSESTCRLDDSIHPEILQRAVELAKAAYIGDINSIVELGKRSE